MYQNYQTKKKKNLNLNPKEVTKVETKKKTTKKTTSKTRLSLNPRTTQKATRNRKTIKQVTQTVVTPVQQPEKKVRRKREPFIIIEKIK